MVLSGNYKESRRFVCIILWEFYIGLKLLKRIYKDLHGYSKGILQGFDRECYRDYKGKPVKNLEGFYGDSVRNSIGILKGFYQGFYHDSTKKSLGVQGAP